MEEKKNITVQNKIKVDVLNADIHFIETNDPNGFLKRNNLILYAGTLDDPITSSCDGFVFDKEKSDYYIVLSLDNYTYGTLTHECIHCVGRIFRDRGILADFENDEAFSYYVGWLVG